jgi:hypothetical protein
MTETPVPATTATTMDVAPSPVPSHERIPGGDALVLPTIEGVRATYQAMDRTVRTLQEECRAVAETIEGLDNALTTITQSGALGPEFTNLGMIGLPVLGALRAVKGVVGQYVKQQTGIPLSTWTDLVASSSAEFASYLSLLDSVTDLSRRRVAAPASGLDHHQAEQDEQVLLDARWQTQAWKQVLSRVSRLGQLVDAVLRVDLRGDVDRPAPAEADRPPGLSGTLQKRLRDVQLRTTEKSGDLREWALQPFVDLRDRIRRLPDQTVELAAQVALLELLLDLEIAQIRVRLGRIAQIDADVIAMRVAANIVLPELAQAIDQAHRRTRRYETYLDSLAEAARSGQITARVHQLLAEEYRSEVATSCERSAALDRELAVWRRDGSLLLQRCIERTELELDLLAARERAGEPPDPDRRAVLHRERDRLHEAAQTLAALTTGS